MGAYIKCLKRVSNDVSHSKSQMGIETGLDDWIVIGKADNVKFIIDSADSCGFKTDKYLEWADVYFKTHMSKYENYPNNVVPIINFPPRLLSEDWLNFLRKKRQSNKENDIAFISQIWAGRDHVVRIFENLYGMRDDYNVILNVFLTPCLRKTYKQKENIICLVDRLNKCDHNCFNRMPHVNKAWNQLASSKLVVLRHGKHMCQSWGVIDHFGMGNCIVFDHDLSPTFSPQINENEHFLNLKIDRDSIDSYSHIPERIAGFLSDENNIKRIRKNNIEYFENHMTPEAIGTYILDTISKK